MFWASVKMGGKLFNMLFVRLGKRCPQAGSLNVDYFLSINRYWSHNSNLKRHRAYMAFLSKIVLSKIHGFVIFVINMVKIASEFVSSPLKGMMKMHDAFL
jgi:hypothetical protein